MSSIDISQHLRRSLRVFIIIYPTEYDPGEGFVKHRTWLHVFVITYFTDRDEADLHFAIDIPKFIFMCEKCCVLIEMT